MRHARVLLGLFAVLALLTAPAAAGAKGDPPPGLTLKGSKKVEQLPPAAAGESVVLLTSESSDASSAGEAQIAADGDLRAADGTALRDAAAASTIWFVTWRQWMESLLWGIPWREEHRGGAYFNGSAVWVRSRLGWDTSGYHRCGYNSGFGFTVSVMSCWKTGDPAFVGNRLTNGDHFRVSALFKGFPISATHEMRYCVWPSGARGGC